jgi:hypothetical protein
MLLMGSQLPLGTVPRMLNSEPAMSFRKTGLALDQFLHVSRVFVCAELECLFG